MGACKPTTKRSLDGDALLGVKERKAESRVQEAAGRYEGRIGRVVRAAMWFQ